MLNSIVCRSRHSSAKLLCRPFGGGTALTGASQRLFLKASKRTPELTSDASRFFSNSQCFKSLGHVANDDITIIESAEGDGATRKHIPTFYDRYVFPEPPELISEGEHDAVVAKVNECMENAGRLFAIVQVTQQQFKITANDLIQVAGYIPAECGSRIRLEKVLLVGGTDFTLVGRPVLKRNLVNIEATVLEKAPSVDIIVKKFRRRKNFERTHRFNALNSVLRINSIEVFPHLE